MHYPLAGLLFIHYVVFFHFAIFLCFIFWLSRIEFWGDFFTFILFSLKSHKFYGRKNLNSFHSYSLIFPPKHTSFLQAHHERIDWKDRNKIVDFAENFTLILFFIFSPRSSPKAFFRCKETAKRYFCMIEVFFLLYRIQPLLQYESYLWHFVLFCNHSDKKTSYIDKSWQKFWRNFSVNQGWRRLNREENIAYDEWKAENSFQLIAHFFSSVSQWNITWPKIGECLS